MDVSFSKSTGIVEGGGLGERTLLLSEKFNVMYLILPTYLLFTSPIYLGMLIPSY